MCPQTRVAVDRAARTAAPPRRSRWNEAPRGRSVKATKTGQARRSALLGKGFAPRRQGEALPLSVLCLGRNEVRKADVM